MKEKLSVTVDEKTLQLVDEAIDGGNFRNRSHVVEFGLHKLLKEDITNGN